MAEEVLGVFPCVVRKQPNSLYITTDRLIFHALGSTADESFVILLRDVSGFIMNKPRPELPPEEQKALIKIQFRTPGSSDIQDRVIDFSGDDRFTSCNTCESLLRQRAGDKAEERRLRIKEEQDRISATRRRFLESHPDIHSMYVYLVSEGGLTPEDFWEQYQDQLVDDSPDSHGFNAAIPIPLRQPDLMSSDMASNVVSAGDRREITMTPERADEIFNQFPRARELYQQLVPNTISEKNFWKRFFHSQYFNLSQGSHAGGGGASRNDAVFDSLLVSSAQPASKPGELPVDPEIDLTVDWFVAESGVFAFRESGSDSANKLEVGGKISGKDGVAHSTLVKRFNESSNMGVRLVPTDESQSLHQRREISHEPSNVGAEDGPVVTRAEIERLRRVRKTVDVDMSQQVEVVPVTAEITKGMDGVARATLDLTAELVVRPNAARTESSRKMRKLESESGELDEYIDRVTELLRFFYNSKVRDGDKRGKLLANLNKIRNEINNVLLPKIRHEWIPTVNMMNNMVSNAETVHANISRNFTQSIKH